MGAALGANYSAIFPKKNNGIVMIDNFGPPIRPVEKSPTILREYIENQAKLFHKKLRGPKTYATLQDAIDARVANVALFPGKQFISLESAKALVSR